MRRIHIVFLFLPPLILGVLLFGFGRIFAGGDAILQYYPYASALSEALQAGSFPLFTNNMLGGFPAAATMSGGFFHPLHLFVLRFLDFLTGYHLLLVFYFALGLYAMYVFLRALGNSPASSTLSAIAYGMGQYSLVWLGVLPHVMPLFIFPTLFYAVLRMKARRWGLWLAAGVMAWGWLAASPHMVSMAIIGAGLFAVFLDYRTAGAWRLKNFSGTATYLLACVLGAAIASPYILFAQRFSEISARPFISFAEYHDGALAPAALLRYLVSSLEIPYLVPAGMVSIGFIPFFLAAFAFFQARREAFTRFFTGLTFFALLAAVTYAPLTLVFHYLPIFKYFRGPGRFVHLAGFALAVLAARGFALVERGEGFYTLRLWVRRAGIFWGAAAGGGIAVSLLVLPLRGRILEKLFAYFDARLYEKTSQLPLEHYYRVIEQYFDRLVTSFSLFSWGPFVFAVGSALAGLWVLRLLAHARIDARLAALCLTGLVMVELGSGFLFLRPFVSRAALTAPSFAKVLAQKPDGVPARVFSFLPLAENYQKTVLRDPSDTESSARFLLAMLAPNANLFWGIPSIDGYDNLMPLRIAEILAVVGSERSTAGESLATADNSAAQKQEQFLERLPLLGRMGVRYVITAVPMSHPDLRLVAQDAVTRYRIPLYLYEYAGVLPIVDFAKAVEYREEGSRVPQEWLRMSEAQAADMSLIECGACGEANEATPNTNGGSRDAASVEEFADGRLAVATRASLPRWLIFRMLDLPGWTAYLDGMPARRYRADGIFQAVRVPAGSHRVQFVFSYRGALFRNAAP